MREKVVNGNSMQLNVKFTQMKDGWTLKYKAEQSPILKATQRLR